MHASVLNGVEAAVTMGQGDRLFADVHGADRAGGKLFDPGDRYISVLWHGFSTLPEPCYAQIVATILLAGVDLFFRGKLEALLPGHHFITADHVESPDMVICDIARVDPDEVADAYPDIPIVGFTNHTDTAGLRRANAAGFDHVLAKSSLDERAPELIRELLASVE